MSVYDDEKPRGLGQESEDAPDFVEPDESTRPNPNNPLSSEDLLKNEANFTESDMSDAGSNSQKTEKDSLDQIEKGYTDEKDPNSKTRLKNGIQGWSNRKKIQIVALIAGIALPFGGGILIGTQTVPFFHLLHIEKVLGIVDMPNTNNKDMSNVHFLRALRSGDLPKTRLGLVQFENHDKLIKRFSERGIRIVSSKVGKINFITLDVSQTFPDLNGKKGTEATKALRERYPKLDPKAISVSSTQGGKVNIRVDLRNSTPSIERALLKDVSRTLKLGQRAYYMPYRHLKTYFSVSDLLHPLRSTRLKAETKLASIIDSWFPSKPKLDGRTGGLRAKLAEFRKKNSGQLKGAGLALAVAGLACTAYGIADEANSLQQGIVTVGQQLTTATRAAANQGMANTDISNEAMLALMANQYQGGKWLADSREWKRLTSQPEPNYSAAENETYEIYRNAFDPNSPLKVFLTTLNYAQVAGKSMIDVCKDPKAQAALIGAGVALTILSFPTTGGVGAIAAWGVLTGGSIILSAVATDALVKAVLPMVSGKIPDVIDLAGANGGDLAVFSAVKTASTVAASEGMFTPATEVSEMQNEVARNIAFDAKNKSFYERVLDPTNPTTISGVAIDNLSPSATNNIARLSSGFTSIGNTVASIPSLLFRKKTFAADYKPLSNTVSSYSQLKNMSDDFNDNEKAVAKLYDSERAKGSTKYFDLALQCNGNKIDLKNDPKFGEYWDITNVQKIDPDSFEYRVNCMKDEVLEDPNYNAMVGSFAMTSTGESTACMETDFASSCDKIGMGLALAATTPTPTNPGPLGPGDGTCDPRTQEIGMMKGYVDGKPFDFNGCAIAAIGCKTITLPDGKKEFNCDQKTADGMKCTGSLSCQPDLSPYAIVNSDVSTAFQNLFEDAKKNKGLTLVATGAFRTMEKQQQAWESSGHNSSAAAPPGYSNHQAGRAVDFSLGYDSSVKSGATCANRATVPTTTYNWLRDNSYKYKIYQYAREAWHFDTDDTSSLRCTKP